MENIKKPNDLFAAVLQLPDVNLFDLAKSDISTDNTQLLSKDYYKNNSNVKKLFEDERGKFNEVAFDNAYNRAALLYNDLGNDEQLVKMLEWDPYDFTAPIGGKEFDIRPTITRDINPYKNLYSRSSINSIDTNDLSLRELAQTGKIYDTEKNEWIDKSANELSFFKKFFGQTLVYAQYDKDVEEIDPYTGNVIIKKKGEWKTDEDGNLYIETLGKRELHGKQVVNPLDLLTVDGSAFNKLDFFDSDGREKSLIGTTAKLAVEIAPLLIPGVNTFYGGYKMAMGLAYVLPTFYKSIEGIFLGDSNVGNETGLWKAATQTQGYLAKFNTRSTSDEGTATMANFEQLAGLVSDVYSQIYEQRAAASLSKIVYKINNKEYMDDLTKIAEKQLGSLAISDQIKGISRTKSNYERIGRAAGEKMQSLSGLEKQRTKLAKSLSLSYMAMTQSAEMYGEALEGGYDRRTAGAASLLSAAGQFALMYDNPMGTWFLDESVGYADTKAGMIKSLKSLITKEFPKLEEAIKVAGTNKELGKKLIGTSFKNVKDGMSNFFSLANTGGVISNIKRNAVIEGLEEVSEQLVMDSVKGVTDFLSHMGLTQKKGSYGGFDVVFSKEGLSNYIMNFLGGTIGGALFEMERSIITPAITGVSPHTQHQVVDFISNGQSDLLLKTAKEYIYKNFNNTSVSPGTEVDSEGNPIMTQADIIFGGVESYVKLVDNILNSEQVKETDDGWIRKAIVDEVKIQDMKANNTDTFVLSDIREIVSEMVGIKARLNIAEKEGKELKEDSARLKELGNQLKDIKEGKKSDYYYGLSLFVLNKNLHEAYISLNVNDYTRDLYDKDFESLSKEEKDKMSNEFKMVTSNEGNFKFKMKKMYEMFMKYNEEFSKPLEDYGKNGYDALRREVLKYAKDNEDTINKAVREKDLNTLKGIWEEINMLQTNLPSQSLAVTELNSSMPFDFGSFLVKTGVVSIGKTYKEMSDILGVPMEQLEDNLKAQTILSRLMEEYAQTIDSLTVADLKKEIVEGKIIPEEGALLLTTVLLENDTDLVKNLYKPEVFELVDPTTLKEEEIGVLGNLINTIAPTLETIEKDFLNQMLARTNMKLLNDLKNFTQVEGSQEVINNVSNARPLYVKTESFISNIHAFINKNRDKFFEPIIAFLGEVQGEIEGDSIGEFIAKKLQESLSAEQTLNEILNSEIIAEQELSREELVRLKNSISAIIEGDYLGNKAYSELLENIGNFIESSLKENTPVTTVELFSVIKESFEYLEALRRSNKTTPIYLGPNTTVEMDKEKLSAENILHGYIVFGSDIVREKEEIINPNIEVLLSIAEPIIKNNEKLDNELVEAAKTELEKLQPINSMYKQGQIDILKDRLSSVIEYGNVQKNTLLSKLREFQITLYGEGQQSKTMFDLLSDLNKQFSISISPSEFKPSIDSKDRIKKSLYTLKAIRGIINAMSTTNTALDLGLQQLTPESLYGYNANFNKMYKKNNIAIELGILGSEDIELLNRELDIIENKLLHFKLLYESNEGGIIVEQNKIKDSLLKSLDKRMTDATDKLSLVNLSFDDRPLVTNEELEVANSLPLEEKIDYLEHVARENFVKIVNDNNGDIDKVLDKIFEPFKNPDLVSSKVGNLLDNQDTILTESMTSLGTKEWYIYAHSILGSSSLDFLESYEKYINNELSLQEGFRAPFYTQKFVMRQAYSYINGKEGKRIMAHIVDFIVPSFSKGLDKNAANYEKEFEKRMNNSTGFGASHLFFIRGTSGTGKSDVLSNFILWAINNNKDNLLGDKFDIIGSAPTQKTVSVLEKAILRNQTNIPITIKTVDDFISDILSGTDYDLIVNDIKRAKDLKEGVYKIDNKNSGVVYSKPTVLFTDAKLDELFKDFKEDIPKVVIIDEASKINSLQYQVLDYLSKNKNYTIIVLGDDLQQGTKIGEATSSMENIYIPYSVKLKSTIRAENNHQNDNSIALEAWAGGIRSYAFYGGEIPKKPILTHSFANGYLEGLRFIDTLSIDELRKLDPKKEILIINEFGRPTEDTLQILKDAFGEANLSNIVWSTHDVQGQEFDQVILMNYPTISFLEKSQDILGTTSSKDLYTLFTRGKVSTLAVGLEPKAKNNFISESKPTSVPKALNINEMRTFLVNRHKEIKELLDNLKAKNLEISKISSSTEEELPLDFSTEEQELEVQLEKNDIDEVVKSESGITETIIESEVNKDKESIKESDNILRSNTKKDVKIITYSGNYNLGVTLPGDVNDEVKILNWIRSLEGKSNLTDFAAYIQNNPLSGQNLVEEFQNALNRYLQIRNEIVGVVTEMSSIPSGKTVFGVTNFLGRITNIDLKDSFYIEAREDGTYSQPYAKRGNVKTVKGTQYFLMVDIDGIPVTITTLAEESTATDSKKNIKGDIDKLKVIYKTLKNNKKTKIDISGKLHLYSGVITQANKIQPIKINADRKTLEETLLGAAILEFRAFRGPKYDLNGELNETTEDEFIDHLDKTINAFNKTKIKFKSNKKYASEKEKGIDAYQRYMFRPYVTISYATNPNFKKVVLLYPKGRSVSEFWKEIETVENKEILINRYSAWKLTEEFLLSLKDPNLQKVAIEWLNGAFDIRSMLSSNPITNMLKASVFSNQMELWDRKEDLAEFIAKNKTLQLLFREIDPISGQRKGFNPMYYIHSYIYNTNIGDDPYDIKTKFLDFISNSKKKVYYNTIILSGEKGDYSGGFNEKLTKYYDIGYYTEMPQLMLDLEGLSGTISNPVKPTTTQQTIDDITIKVSIDTSMNVEKALTLPIDLELQVTRSITPKILNVIATNNSEIESLKNYISTAIDSFITDNDLEYEQDEQTIIRLLTNSGPGSLSEHINNWLLKKNTQLSVNDTSLSVYTNKRPSYCKIS